MASKYQPKMRGATLDEQIYPMCCMHCFGKFGWANKMADVSLVAQSFSAHGMALHLVKDREQVTRISPLIATKKFELDGARKIPSLRGLGDFEARKATPYSVKGSLKHPAKKCSTRAIPSTNVPI
jgi:hypothetical protein